MTKFTPENRQALVNILLRYWGEILAIEEEYGLLVGQGDHRPRIEFFHDAIRAYTTESKTDEEQARLSAERLAHDVRCLHYLSHQPLSSITHQQDLSPHTALVPGGPGLIEQKKKPGRETKEQLRELYGKYGVLFSALMRTTVENDVLDRSEDINQQIEEINQLIHALEEGETGLANNIVAHLSDDKLRHELQTILPTLKGKNPGGLIAKLKGDISRKDKAVKAVDGAHLQYSSAQLALYEESRDMLKQMAGKGMNLVGQFVEYALRQSERDRGR